VPCCVYTSTAIISASLSNEFRPAAGLLLLLLTKVRLCTKEMIYWKLDVNPGAFAMKIKFSPLSDVVMVNRICAINRAAIVKNFRLDYFSPLCVYCNRVVGCKLFRVHCSTFYRFASTWMSPRPYWVFVWQITIIFCMQSACFSRKLCFLELIGLFLPSATTSICLLKINYSSFQQFLTSQLYAMF
jgi:hypothetical protein